MVVTGTLRRADVETGPLVLHGDDGVVWEIILPAGWTVDSEPGTRVTVRGERLDEVESTAQVGPRLRVRSLGRPE